MQIHKHVSIKKLITIAIIAVLSFSVLLNTQYASNRVDAATIDELQDRSVKLQAEIEANNNKLVGLRGEIDTLQGKVDQLNAEIEVASKQIELTEVKLAELRQRLKETEEELERQKGLLKAALRALYEKRDASTVELLIASDSFADFINEQEYLARLQSAVKQSADQVVKLKQQIEIEKKEQEELLKKQEEQKNLLAAKRAEQQDILEKTQGEESRYASIVANQKEELEEAEKQLAALLSAGNYVSLGPISRGQQVGQVGSTGYSTGPHIHFQIYRNGSTVNPHAGGTSIINGYTWPTPGNYRITTPYGWVHCSNYTGCGGGDYSVWHSGLDIGANGYSPVVAVADGDIIFKGCKGGLGYVVVIDHGGGWQSWYPHMITPSGQVYGYCG